MRSDQDNLMSHHFLYVKLLVDAPMKIQIEFIWFYASMYLFGFVSFVHELYGYTYV